MQCTQVSPVVNRYRNYVDMTCRQPSVQSNTVNVPQHFPQSYKQYLRVERCFTGVTCAEVKTNWKQATCDAMKSAYKAVSGGDGKYTKKEIMAAWGHLGRADSNASMVDTNAQDSASTVILLRADKNSDQIISEHEFIDRMHIQYPYDATALANATKLKNAIPTPAPTSASSSHSVQIGLLFSIAFLLKAF